MEDFGTILNARYIESHPIDGALRDPRLESDLSHRLSSFCKTFCQYNTMRTWSIIVWSDCKVVVSPRLKFILITIDEIILVVLAVIAVYYILPQYLVPAIILSVAGTALFIAVKYYLVYPVLNDDTTRYDIVGMTGRVIKTVTASTGKIRLGGEIWEARSDEGPLETGTEVVVMSREGIFVRVTPRSRTEPDT